MKRRVTAGLLLAFMLPALAGAAQPTPKPTPTKKADKIRKPSGFDQGLEYALAVVHQYRLVDDLEVTDRLNRIGRRIAAAAGEEDLACSFRAIQMEDPNAFALPGGFVFITQGMLELELTDDEMAHLMAHELGHVVLNHHARLSRRAAWMSLLQQALLVGLILGVEDDYRQSQSLATEMGRRDQGLEGKDALVIGTLAFGDVFRILLQQGFSREMEREADLKATEWAWRAGFDPLAGVGLMEKLRRRIYEAPGMSYWRSHPYFDDRVVGARARSGAYPVPPTEPVSQESLDRFQRTLHELSRRYDDPSRRWFLQESAFWAAPTTIRAEEIHFRLARDAWDRELQRAPFLRDYSGLASEMERAVTGFVTERPEPSREVQELQSLVEEITHERDRVLPQFLQGLDGNYLGTPDLERFLENFPDSPRRVEALFRLAEHRRLAEDEWRAVDRYLEVLREEPDGPWSSQTAKRLVAMIDRIQRPAPLVRIVQEGPAELAGSTRRRLTQVCREFDDLESGKRTLSRWPGSEWDQPVRKRLDELAQSTYNAGRQCEAIGRYQQALDRYNQVLDTAPSDELVAAATERLEILKKGLAGQAGT